MTARGRRLPGCLALLFLFRSRSAVSKQGENGFSFAQRGLSMVWWCVRCMSELIYLTSKDSFSRSGDVVHPQRENNPPFLSNWKGATKQ